MPIYGYRCSECGHQFEVQQNFSDERLTECPKCKGKLTRIFYPAGVIFKGSGFYTTDYKGTGKGAGSNGSDSGSSSGSGSEGKSDKSESKPESKADSAD